METARLVIDDKGINLSGISEIISFNDSSFEGISSKGVIQITGDGLKMEKTNVEDGRVFISGSIISVYYPECEKPKKPKKFGVFG